MSEAAQARALLTYDRANTLEYQQNKAQARFVLPSGERGTGQGTVFLAGFLGAAPLTNAPNKFKDSGLN